MGENQPADFQDILDRHFDRVYGYVAYRLAPNVEAAGDITQEVFLAAFKNWNGYRGDGSPLTWLQGIARRKVVDHFRALAAGKARFQADGLELAASPDRTERQERALLTSQAMRSLPADQARLLEAKYLEGLSVRRIARQRGTTEKAVESALGRARRAFRDNFRKLQADKEI
ncbi:MAG TPA: sigma-70 family RNA polymerase sigma factor [Phycisphaerae bacterium]|nr:sigma-70 family RNA polymerase sigma factor [Phycisphaerae bacterium]